MKHENYIISPPLWIVQIVIIMINLEEIHIPRLRLLAARAEIFTLVQYDKSLRSIGGYAWLWPVARVFSSVCVVFLLITCLEGVAKWIH